MDHGRAVRLMATCVAAIVAIGEAARPDGRDAEWTVGYFVAQQKPALACAGGASLEALSERAPLLAASLMHLSTCREDGFKDCLESLADFLRTGRL